MHTFHGTLPALVTPFRNDRVDEEALRALVEHCITGGVDGLVPCGTTGESVTLSYEEHMQVVRATVDQAKGRVPVLAGAGTVSTAHTIHLAQGCKQAGADGLLLVTPYYNRPTQAGLEAHYRAVLKACSMPTVLYNIPGRTGCDMAIETLGRLADVTDVIGVKEATGNVLRGQQIVAKYGDRFAIWSGDDALTLPMLAFGAVGVISVTANLLPKPVSDVVRLFKKGDLAAARRQHLALLSVHDAMFVESNPGPVKAALADQGLLAREIRLPLVWPSDATVAFVQRALQALA